jgi:hypothetical protein
MLKSNVEINDQQLVDENVGEHIGYDLGVKMVKDYFDTYGEGGAQFVGKNILSKILEQPNCIGINIYKGLNEKGEKSYVLVGLDKENNPILNYSIVNIEGQMSQKEGIVADRNKAGNGWFEYLS